MLHQYNVTFKAGNHKGGKTYIRRLLGETKDALTRDPHFVPDQASEFIASEIGLVKEGINAEYLNVMCNKFSSGVENTVKFLFRRIGRYVQDNGYWPNPTILRHWPEYTALKGGRVKDHPSAAYMHHRHYSKGKKSDTLAEVELILEVGKLEKQIQDGLAQQMAKEAKTTKEAYSHLSKECKRLRDVLMVLESRVLTLEEGDLSALEEARELYQVIKEAAAPTPAKSSQGGFWGYLRGKQGGRG